MAEKKKDIMSIFKEYEDASAPVKKPEPEKKPEEVVLPKKVEVSEPSKEEIDDWMKKAPKSIYEPPKKVFTKKAEEIEFDLSPTRALVKHVILVYGNKGDGKTTLGQSFGKSQIDISFDQKTESVRESSKFKDHILVFDGTRYLDKSSPDEWLSSSERTWRYINQLLDRIPDVDEKKSTDLVIKEDGDYREYVSGNPDWIMVDAGEVFETVAEMVMRSRNGIMAFEGFANKNLWKERRMYLDQLLRKCTRKSKKGVVWTSYCVKDEVVVNGEFVAKLDVPKWIDCVLRETDVLIRAERSTGKSGQGFFATVESSKWKAIPESRKTDITGKGIEALTKGEI